MKGGEGVAVGITVNNETNNHFYDNKQLKLTAKCGMEKRHLIDSLMMFCFVPSFKQKTTLRGSKFKRC